MYFKVNESANKNSPTEKYFGLSNSFIFDLKLADIRVKALGDWIVFSIGNALMFLSWVPWLWA